MAIPILNTWQSYFLNHHEGLGSSYERIVLNNLLTDIVNTYNIQSVLETPSFGFTGLSGINSLGLAKLGCAVTIEDQDSIRLKMIQEIWGSCSQIATFKENQSLLSLDFDDDSFDMMWNFSALWFVPKLDSFLSEACRVSKKAILLCVPNQSGMGYRMQFQNSTAEERAQLNIFNINPNYIRRIMIKRGWHQIQSDFIDCPPWPDIGMSKEDFLNKHCMLCKYLNHGNSCKINTSKSAKELSILSYYRDKDPQFANNMMKHYWFEKHLPRFLKKYWAHHYYMLFVPQ